MKKLPIIRYFRWLILCYLLNRHVKRWGALCASQEDIDYLDKVKSGKL